MNASTTTPAREYIIIGQCQGTGYALWDIAPAPLDLTRRQVVMEELEVDAMDALGSVNIIWGASAREAVDGFLADMRQQSGLDDYGLTADSRLDSLENVTEPVTATARTAARTGMISVTATIIPGAASLNVSGASSYDTGVTERILDALDSIGYKIEAEVTVDVGFHRQPTGTLDLAMACAVLGTAGDVERATLARTCLIGEIGRQGKVGSLPGMTASVRTAIASGVTEIVVPKDAAPQLAPLNVPAGVRVHRVASLTEAVQVLALIAAG